MVSNLDNELSQLSSRCDFCQSSLENMKKEISAYLKKKADASKQTTALAKVLRDVAATERNSKLQESLFSCATTFTSLDQHLVTYQQCEEQTKLVLEEAKKILVSPLREILKDGKESLIKRSAKSNTDGKTQDDYRTKYMEHTLPLHSDFFEKHRIRYMKSVLRSILHSELTYHCRVIESLSPLFEALADVEEEESVLM